jgi:hypothetical protein
VDKIDYIWGVNEVVPYFRELAFLSSGVEGACGHSLF